MSGQMLQDFSVSIHLKSQLPITNIYSPSHPITYRRPNDREAVIGFEKNAALLDRDFQLFYQAGTKDIGLTAVTHRPNADQDGHFMLLLSPRAELSKTQQVPRDFVYGPGHLRQHARHPHRPGAEGTQILPEKPQR